MSFMQGSPSICRVENDANRAEPGALQKTCTCPGHACHDDISKAHLNESRRQAEDHGVKEQGVHIGVKCIAALEHRIHVVTATTNKSSEMYPGIE